MAGIPARRSKRAGSTARRWREPPTASAPTTEVRPTAQDHAARPEGRFLAPREPVVAQQGVPDALGGARDVLNAIMCGFGEFRERLAEMCGRFCCFLLQGVRPAGLSEAGIKLRTEVGQGRGDGRDGLGACGV